MMSLKFKIGLCSLFILLIIFPVQAATVSVDPKAPRPISTTINGYPVYSYGDISVYGVSPTFDDSVVLQQGNNNSWTKIVPKKAWEIQSNLIGLTPTRSPSSHADELEPFHKNFFVDNNPATQGYAGRPVGDPEITRAWIQIDLPRPMKITAVGMAGAIPANFDIRVFNWDMWQRQQGGNAAGEQKRWQTVYKVAGNQAQLLPTPDNTAPNVYELQQTTSSSGSPITRYRFDPVPAREIWITSPDDITLEAIEIYNEADENVALISKGCGVDVSASQHLFWADQQTQAAFWQMQYDMGIKWLRLSYYLTPLIWTFVERDKGVYTIDPYLDQLVTEAVENGIEVTLTLGPPENTLYTTEEDRVNGFCNYAAFMVKHFKGRVNYYEILNEFYNQDAYGPGNQGPVETRANDYLRTALPAAKVIEKANPSAKICLCGPCPLVADFILTVLKKGMAKHVDVITWHPYSFMQDTDDDYPPEQLDRIRHVWVPEGMTTYAQAVKYLRAEAAQLGFSGELWANESGAYTIHNNRTTNLIGAKYTARSLVLHTALDVPVFWNETTSLMRPSWQPFWKPDMPGFTPTYSYYMMRTLGTLLDRAKPAELAVTTNPAPDNLQVHSFKLPNNRQLIALWLIEKSRKNRYDDYPAKKLDITIPVSQSVNKVMGTDLLNGRKQEMLFEKDKEWIHLSDLMVSDYPFIIEIQK